MQELRIANCVRIWVWMKRSRNFTLGKNTLLTQTKIRSWLKMEWLVFHELSIQIWKEWRLRRKLLSQINFLWSGIFCERHRKACLGFNFQLELDEWIIDTILFWARFSYILLNPLHLNMCRTFLTCCMNLIQENKMTIIYSLNICSNLVVINVCTCTYTDDNVFIK